MLNREKETALRGPMAKVNLTIDWDVYNKIMYWVRKAPGEISGLGKVLVQEDGTFRVISACLVEQENGSASTELDGAAVAKVMYEMREQPGHLNFWWHSHVNMSVFWSGTDIDTIREVGSNGWLLATVFNKKNEMKSAFYSKADGVLPEIFIDDITTATPRYLRQEDIDRWEAEYAAKTKERVWSRSSTFVATGDADLYNESWNGAYSRSSGRYIQREELLKTHEWGTLYWHPKKLSKKEKKALKKAQTASGQSSTASGTEQGASNLETLIHDIDETICDWYTHEVDFFKAHKVLARVMKMIEEATISDASRVAVRDEYQDEFNQLFKEEIQYEEMLLAQGYCQ